MKRHALSIARAGRCPIVEGRLVCGIRLQKSADTCAAHRRALDSEGLALDDLEETSDVEVLKPAPVGPSPFKVVERLSWILGCAERDVERSVIRLIREHDRLSGRLQGMQEALDWPNRTPKRGNPGETP